MMAIPTKEVDQLLSAIIIDSSHSFQPRGTSCCARYIMTPAMLQPMFATFEVLMVLKFPQGVRCVRRLNESPI